MVGRGKIEMSNTKPWRSKPRTSKPNARQKRNGLYLDAHPLCHRCKQRPAKEAHHALPYGHPHRYDWRHMEALCVQCHLTAHQRVRIVGTFKTGR